MGTHGDSGLRNVLQGAIHQVRQWLDPTSRNLLATAMLLGGPSRRAKPIVQWPERRVLVLAPHADDEVIGCGGAVALHARAGAEVRVAIATDGALGDARLHDPGLAGDVKAALQREVVLLRQAEARAACGLLGAREPTFLEAPDGGLRAEGEPLAKLQALIADFKPDMIYLPFVMDQHEDHWQCNQLLRRAVEGLAKQAGGDLGNVVVRGYEVWAPLVANRLADITTVAATKRAALQAYASQLKDRDYSAAIGGLNQYRAMHLPESEGRQAEAFYETSVAGYLHLMHAMRRAPATSA